MYPTCCTYAIALQHFRDALRAYMGRVPRHQALCKACLIQHQLLDAEHPTSEHSSSSYNLLPPRSAQSATIYPQQTIHGQVLLAGAE
mmetsp:Transcript_14495/g.36056  ORF Transcript_14495/g.36056 Transcript_14495/m.36056 type:complete len:87 (+) Transcript_14495:382-642(+)